LRNRGAEGVVSLEGRVGGIRVQARKGCSTRHCLVLLGRARLWAEFGVGVWSRVVENWAAGKIPRLAFVATHTSRGASHARTCLSCGQIFFACLSAFPSISLQRN